MMTSARGVTFPLPVFVLMIRIGAAAVEVGVGSLHACTVTGMSFGSEAIYAGFCLSIAHCHCKKSNAELEEVGTCPHEGILQQLS